jgi:hypothetical protein
MAPDKQLKALIKVWWICFITTFSTLTLDGPEVYAATDSLNTNWVWFVLGEGLFALLALGVLLILLIFAMVALYRIKPIGRTLFLIATSVAFGLNLLVGYVVMNPVSYLANALLLMTTGAILLLIYSEEGKKMFAVEQAPVT